jgi:hypothetical protein
MTKKTAVFFILFFQSCSVFNISDYPSIAKTIVFGVDEILIDKNFYLEMQYSFAVVNIGKYKKSILILASVKGDEYLWVGSNGEKVFTVNGKIQKSYGLDHDIKFITGATLDFNGELNSYSSVINLKNPEAIISSNYKLDYDGDELNVFNSSLKSDIVVNGKFKKFIEKYDAKILNWKGENIYWVNQDGQVIRTIQSYHPMESDIEITFYYK